MTQQVSGAVASGDLGPSGRPSPLKVVRDQRKAFVLAAILIATTYWVAGPLGEWGIATCVAGGIVLGLANHLATEYWLLKVITSGDEPSRHQMVASTMVRLVILTVVAVSVAAAFWPDGIGLLLGLAVFRLVALVMTGLPLLKELKKP